MPEPAAHYGTDLAYIQHEGFGDFARGAAPGLLRDITTFRRAGFSVRRMRGYGRQRLAPRRMAFRARLRA